MRWVTCSGHARRRSRPGFTLTELIVVVLIVASLVAITAAAISRAVSGQGDSNTELTLQKASRAVNQQWTAALQQAEEEFRSDSMTDKNGTRITRLQLGGDPDTVLQTWKRYRLQQEFPTSFVEANTEPTIPTTPPIYLRKKYDTLIQFIPAGDVPPNRESSILLLLALGQTRKGQAFPVDEAFGQNAIRDINGGRVLMDVWKSPIGFTRGTDGFHFELISSGPDLIPGTFDDVSSRSMRRFGMRGDRGY